MPPLSFWRNCRPRPLPLTFVLAVFPFLFFVVWLSTPSAGGMQIRNRNKEAVAVLLFHAIDPDPSLPHAITPVELEKTFQALRKKGYFPLRLEEFHAFLQGKRLLRRPGVLITFDDGYADIYEFALPLTQKYRFPAVVFAVTKWFEPHRRPESHRPHLSKEQAAALLKSGYWYIAGHSYDGHHLVQSEAGRKVPFYLARKWLSEEGRRETEEERRARLWQDILLTRVTLERVGVKNVADFAYPYGAWDEMTRTLLLEAGFRFHYTTEPGLNYRGQDPTRIKRIIASSKADDTIRILEQFFGH